MAANLNVLKRNKVPRVLMVLQNHDLTDEEKFAKIMQLYPEQKKLLTTEQLDELVLGVHKMSTNMNWRQPTLYLKCAQVLVMIGTSEALGWVEEMESRVKHAKEKEHWAALEPLLSQLQQLIPGKVREVQLEKMLEAELKKPILMYEEQMGYVNHVVSVSDHRGLFNKHIVLLGLEVILNGYRFDDFNELVELEKALSQMLLFLFPSLCTELHPVYVLCVELHQRVVDFIELHPMLYPK